MRTILVFAFTLFVAACGGSSKPDTSEPTPDPSTDETPPDEAPAETVSPEDCEASGGTVAWDIGDGNVACPPGLYESSAVSGGVEPGLCCQQTPDTAE